MKAKTSLKELHRSANTYIDACRRFFSAIERWETNGVYEEVEGIDWTALREFERQEVLLSMSLVERAVEHLLMHSDEFEATLPDQWKAILPSSVRLGKLACENARALGWFEDMLGSFSGHQAAHQLKKSVMLLTFVASPLRSKMNQRLIAPIEIGRMPQSMAPIIGVVHCTSRVSNKSIMMTLSTRLMEN
jgi:hypothetical protein